MKDFEDHRRKATHHVSMIQHTLTRLTMDLNNALCLLGCTAEEGMNDAEEFAFLDSEFSINDRSCVHGKYLPFKDGDCYEDHNYTPFDLLLEVPKSVGRTVLEDLIPTLHELREVIGDWHYCTKEWHYCTKEKKKEEKEESTG